MSDEKKVKRVTEKEEKEEKGLQISVVMGPLPGPQKAAEGTTVYCSPPPEKNYIRVIPSRPLEDAILDCFTDIYNICVVSQSLEDAIHKILYALDALEPTKRDFFLRQIGMHLKKVLFPQVKKYYNAGNAIRDLIYEDKLYRIAKREEEIFTNNELLNYNEEDE